MLRFVLIGVVVSLFVLYRILSFLHARRESQELQVLTILGTRRLTTMELIDALVTCHFETKSKAWPVLPVLRRLARKGCVQCVEARRAILPCWVIADAGKHRLAARAKKDA